jgi:hypothetical protein
MKKKSLKNKTKRTTTKRVRKSVPVQQEIDFTIPPAIEQQIDDAIVKISEEDKYPLTGEAFFNSIDKQIADLQGSIQTLKAIKRQERPGIIRRFLRRLFRRS